MKHPEPLAQCDTKVHFLLLSYKIYLFMSRLFLPGKKNFTQPDFWILTHSQTPILVETVSFMQNIEFDMLT